MNAFKRTYVHCFTSTAFVCTCIYNNISFVCWVIHNNCRVYCIVYTIPIHSLYLSIYGTCTVYTLWLVWCVHARLSNDSENMYYNLILIIMCRLSEWVSLYWIIRYRVTCWMDVGTLQHTFGRFSFIPFYIFFCFIIIIIYGYMYLLVHTFIAHAKNTIPANQLLYIIHLVG